jgi:tetratricopeptide (TPR) repeat protein
LLAEGRLEEAVFALRKAILKAPQDPEGYRVMATVLERTGSPVAAQWWARVIETGGTNLQDQLRWAEAALRSGDYPVAARALGSLGDAARGVASYHKLSGVLAVALRNAAAAEKHFLAAIQLEPTNPAPQLNLAALRLVSTNRSVADTGRTTMQQLAGRPDVGREATRHLLGDAMRHDQNDRAVAYGRQLLAGTNVAFSDRILHLDALKAARSAELGQALLQVQQAAGTNAAQVFDLARWMFGAGQVRESLTWIRNRPPEIQRAYPVRLLTVECLVSLEDLNGLAAYLDSEPWGDQDYHRLLLQMRLHNIRKETAAGSALWKRALRAASTDRDRLVQVLRLTKEWRLLPEYEEALSALIERSPRETWALVELATLYHAEGKTRQLQKLLARTLELAPTNAVIKNNLAMTSLLLDPRDARGPRLAREAYETATTNGQFAATYAFSLLRQDQPDQALAVLQKLDPRWLEEPAVGVYYGMVLQEAGRSQEAARYLALADKATLLPEESNLVAHARSGRPLPVP